VCHSYGEDNEGETERHEEQHRRRHVAITIRAS
jgi:hypothetical protein